MFPSFFQVSFLKSGTNKIFPIPIPIFMQTEETANYWQVYSFSKTCSSPSVEFCWPQPGSRVIFFNWSVNIGRSSRQVNTQRCRQQWSNDKPVLGQLSCYASESWFVAFHDDKLEQTLMTTVSWNFGHNFNSYMDSFPSPRWELQAHSFALLSECWELLNTVFIKGIFF